MKKSQSEFVLYNTMSKQKEVFKTEPGKVSMYVCGVTTYDLSHIGHARAYVAFDVLYRYLKYLGYEVDYVRNFTDIDDKVLQQLKEKALVRAGITEDYVLQQINERAAARDGKDYKRSDQIRSDLTTLGIALMDVGKDSIWRPCVPSGRAEAPVSST